MAVNLSAVQLRNPTLPQALHQLLRQTGLPGSALTLEITESVAMQDPQACIERLDAIRQLGGRVRIHHFGQHHHKLVAAQARHDVVVAHRGGQPLGRGTQELVAHRVPQCVVDGLEVVHVQKHHGQAPTVAPCVGHQLVQTSLQRIAVGQARQGVAVRQAFDRFGREMLLRDIGVDRDKGAVGQRQATHFQNRAVRPRADELVLANLHAGLAGEALPARAA